jgi:hypothetical protein
VRRHTKEETRGPVGKILDAHEGAVSGRREDTNLRYVICEGRHGRPRLECRLLEACPIPPRRWRSERRVFSHGYSP